MSTTIKAAQQTTYTVNAGNGWHEDNGEPVTPDHPQAQIAALYPVVLALTDVIESVRREGKGVSTPDLLQDLALTAGAVARDGLFVTASRSGDNGSKLHGSATQTIARLMLIVTEVAEAITAVDRRDVQNFMEETADIVIRALDVIGGLAAIHGPKFDLEAAILAKLEQNKARGYRHGGKRA